MSARKHTPATVTAWLQRHPGTVLLLVPKGIPLTGVFAAAVDDLTTDTELIARLQILIETQEENRP